MSIHHFSFIILPKFRKLSHFQIWDKFYLLLFYEMTQHFLQIFNILILTKSSLKIPAPGLIHWVYLLVIILVLHSSSYWCLDTMDTIFYNLVEFFSTHCSREQGFPHKGKRKMNTYKSYCISSVVRIFILSQCR